eukprot:11838343-Alexandrium_andersonii.AAC.1
MIDRAPGACACDARGVLTWDAVCWVAAHVHMAREARARAQGPGALAARPVRGHGHADTSGP